MEIILKIENLNKQFNHKPVLKEINFNLKKSNITGLIGPDGSGKTTLLRILIGALLPEKGNIIYKNHRINTLNDLEHIKLKIGYIPQYYGLYTDLTVYENLEYFGKLYLIPALQLKERINTLLKFVRLDRFSNRKAGALSGGMYKKLAIAVSLLHNPEILILDEPTNGVDPVSRSELWELFFQLKEQNKSILIATPYMEEAERCDEILLLYNGNMLFYGNLDDFLKTFRINVLTIDIKDYYNAYMYLKSNLEENLFLYLSGRKIRILYENDQFINKIKKILNKKYNNYNIKNDKIKFEDLFIHCIKMNIL